MLYDDNGAHPGLQAAEFIAEAGARLELVTPERFFAADVGGLNHVPYARCFKEHGVTITINTRLVSVRLASSSARSACCPPSTSTIRHFTMQTKSTMNGPTGLCLRK